MAISEIEKIHISFLQKEIKRQIKILCRYERVRESVKINGEILIVLFIQKDLSKWKLALKITSLKIFLFIGLNDRINKRHLN